MKLKDKKYRIFSLVLLVFMILSYSHNLTAKDSCCCKAVYKHQGESNACCEDDNCYCYKYLDDYREENIAICWANKKDENNNYKLVDNNLANDKLVYPKLKDVDQHHLYCHHTKPNKIILYQKLIV